jgi:hypothetical protein
MEEIGRRVFQNLSLPVEKLATVIREEAQMVDLAFSHVNVQVFRFIFFWWFRPAYLSRWCVSGYKLPCNSRGFYIPFSLIKISRAPACAG